MALRIAASVPYSAVRDVLPDGMRQARDSALPAPAGLTVRYEGMVETRAATIPPELQFVVDIASSAVGGVIAGLVTAWVTQSFRGRATKVTINRREINLDDNGQIRQVIEDELRIE
jgi:hypothetical protein